MVSVTDAVLDMILQDYLGGIIERRAHRRKLDEHIGAVPSLLDHALHRLEVPDGAGKAVDDGAGIGVRVAVAGRFVRMLMLERLLGRVIVARIVQMGDAVGVQILVVMLVFKLLVVLVFHCAGSFLLSVCSIAQFCARRNGVVCVDRDARAG